MDKPPVLKNVDIKFLNYKNFIPQSMQIDAANEVMAEVISTAYTWNGDLAKDKETLRNNFNKLIKYIESIFEDEEEEKDREAAYDDCCLNPEDMQYIFDSLCNSIFGDYLDPLEMHLAINNIKLLLPDYWKEV